MYSNSMRTTACAGVPPVARASAVERRLKRFPVRVRSRVAALAARHSRLADLSVSFPALLVALAVPRPGFDPEPAVARVIAGESLGALCQLAGVPNWTRKLAPETFERALPRLPDGDLFRLQIANHLPRSTKLAPVWLEMLAEAAAIGNEQIAIWIAREVIRDAKSVQRERLRRVCLWAWYSGQVGTRGHALCTNPWTPSISFKAARGEAFNWIEQVKLYLDLGDEPVADMWIEPGAVDGFDFVPLRTAKDVADEAAAMKNCLATYGGHVGRNLSRLWSVRKAGRRVATLEVSTWCGAPFPSIRQLKGIANADCPADLWMAALIWLYSSDVTAVVVNTKRWSEQIAGRDAWVALWRPYWKAKRRLPYWLPLAPSPLLVDEI
jgi:hypothetical protein